MFFFSVLGLSGASVITHLLLLSLFWTISLSPSNYLNVCSIKHPLCYFPALSGYISRPQTNFLAGPEYTNTREVKYNCFLIGLSTFSTVSCVIHQQTRGSPGWLQSCGENSSEQIFCPKKILTYCKPQLIFKFPQPENYCIYIYD